MLLEQAELTPPPPVASLDSCNIPRIGCVGPGRVESQNVAGYPIRSCEKRLGLKEFLKGWHNKPAIISNETEIGTLEFELKSNIAGKYLSPGYLSQCLCQPRHGTNFHDTAAEEAAGVGLRDGGPQQKFCLWQIPMFLEFKFSGVKVINGETGGCRRPPVQSARKQFGPDACRSRAPLIAGRITHRITWDDHADAKGWWLIRISACLTRPPSQTSTGQPTLGGSPSRTGGRWCPITSLKRLWRCAKPTTLYLSDGSVPLPHIVCELS